jgi:hypothetical protein
VAPVGPCGPCGPVAPLAPVAPDPLAPVAPVGPCGPVAPVAPIPPEVTTPVNNAPLPRIYEPVMLPVTLAFPATDTEVKVPRLVILACTALVTLPAVLANTGTALPKTAKFVSSSLSGMLPL